MLSSNRNNSNNKVRDQRHCWRTKAQGDQSGREGISFQDRRDHMFVSEIIA